MRQKNKKIDLYTFIYNDEDILPFFLDYYSFVDRMTFIDSGSTDKTLSILKKYATEKHPTIQIVETGLNWWDHNTLHRYRDELWRRDKSYDLVLFPDCDEFFFTFNGIKNYLNNTFNDYYITEGYEMVSEKFPEPGTKITDIKTGFRFPPFNKPTVFNPKTEIRFLNAHLCMSPSTNVDMSGSIKLLHYRNLSFAYMKKRQERTNSRVPKGYNGFRVLSDDQLRSHHNMLLSKSSVVI